MIQVVLKGNASMDKVTKHMFSFMKGATFRSESIYFWNNPIYI